MNDRGYEEGAAGTNKSRKSDLLTEYSDKELMTPARLKVEGPTAVKRDPKDLTITSEGQPELILLKLKKNIKKRFD